MESISLDIGRGPPRFRDTNGKIYHGARPSETITSGGKQKQGWFNYCFFVKPDNVRLTHPDKWDTYSYNEFCSNCELVKIRKSGEKVFRCMGH